MIRQVCFHCRGNTQCSMNPTEIIPPKMQADSGFQMRQLLTESIRESRESAKLHPHRQVLPLNKTGRNMVRVGVALSNLGYNPRDAWWGVSRFRAVELPEVAIRSEALRDAHGVVVQSVSR